MSTFIFDLDMTLLDTVKLSHLRMSRNWTEVESRMGEVMTFEVGGEVVHELPRKLSALGHKIGVVTNSPGWYAKKLINDFDIYTDIVVGYGDTEKHKPEPDPLLYALEQLEVGTEDAYHVGDTWEDNKAAYLAGMISIGVGWGQPHVQKNGYCSKSPDIYLLDPSLLLRPNSLWKLGYIGEVFCCGSDVVYHRGSKIKSGENPKSFALGRYYKGEDPRRGNSELSKRILDFKNGDDFAEFFADCSARFLNKQKWKPDIITVVPPKPGAGYERFEKFCDFLANDRLHFDTSIKDNIVSCMKDMPNYKGFGAAEREKVIVGAYEAKAGSWGKVLVIDDVQSSGATSREVSRALLKSGATEVRFLAFGLSQSPPFQLRDCPECGMRLRIRTNGYTGDDFWACTGWKGSNDPDSCKYTESV